MENDIRNNPQFNFAPGQKAAGASSVSRPPVPPSQKPPQSGAQMMNQPQRPTPPTQPNNNVPQRPQQPGGFAPQRPAMPQSQNAPQRPPMPQQSSGAVPQRPAMPQQPRPQGNMPPPPTQQPSVPPRAQSNAFVPSRPQGQNPMAPQRPPMSQQGGGFAPRPPMQQPANYQNPVYDEEYEVEVARYQCEEDENEAANPDNEDVIERSYKSGLSDQDRQRKRKKTRRLLILLLSLLFFAGGVTAAYFIVKNSTEYVPEYYDNVAIEISEFEIKDNSVKFAGSEIDVVKPIVVSVNADTEDVNYDIVALGVKISATYEESGEDCSSILDVHFSDLSQVYVNNNIQFTDGNYIRNAKNLMIYYNKVLEPGESESLIDGFRINKNTDNTSANQKIVIKIKVFAVYPNPVQIREAQSEFVNAPQDWVDLVYDQLTEIFKERAKRR